MVIGRYLTEIYHIPLRLRLTPLHPQILHDPLIPVQTLPCSIPILVDRRSTQRRGILPTGVRGDARAYYAGWVDGGVFSTAAKERREAVAGPNGTLIQHNGSFAEAKIAAPATPTHIRCQFLYRRLDANSLGPSRDFTDSSLEPIQSLRCRDSRDF